MILLFLAKNFINIAKNTLPVDALFADYITKSLVYRWKRPISNKRYIQPGVDIFRDFNLETFPEITRFMARLYLRSTYVFLIELYEKMFKVPKYLANEEFILEPLVNARNWQLRPTLIGYNWLYTKTLKTLIMRYLMVGWWAFEDFRLNFIKWKPVLNRQSYLGLYQAKTRRPQLCPIPIIYVIPPRIEKMLDDYIEKWYRREMERSLRIALWNDLLIFEYGEYLVENFDDIEYCIESYEHGRDMYLLCEQLILEYEDIRAKKEQAKFQLTLKNYTKREKKRYLNDFLQQVLWIGVFNNVMDLWSEVEKNNPRIEPFYLISMSRMPMRAIVKHWREYEEAKEAKKAKAEEAARDARERASRKTYDSIRKNKIQ